jgi:hypothetical protein
MEGPTVRPRSEPTRRRGAASRGRTIAVLVALLTLAGLGTPAVAAAQGQQPDPGASSSSVPPPEEPPETTVPEDPTTTTTTTTEPEEPADTTVPEDAGDDGVPDESTGSEEPTAVDASGDDDGTDPADALTWAAIGLTLLLLGVGVGWMLRRPAGPSGPPSDTDWPGRGDLV